MKLTLEFPKEEQQTEQDRISYCAAIFAVFPRLEKDIKTKMYEQLVATYTTSVGTSKKKEERDFEIVRGNGVLEGMAVLLEEWRVASKEHEAKSRQEEPFDRHNPLPDV